MSISGCLVSIVSCIYQCWYLTLTGNPTCLYLGVLCLSYLHRGVGVVLHRHALQVDERRRLLIKLLLQLFLVPVVRIELVLSQNARRRTGRGRAGQGGAGRGEAGRGGEVAGAVGSLLDDEKISTYLCSSHPFIHSSTHACARNFSRYFSHHALLASCPSHLKRHNLFVALVQPLREGNHDVALLEKKLFVPIHLRQEKGVVIEVRSIVSYSSTVSSCQQVDTSCQVPRPGAIVHR